MQQINISDFFSDLSDEEFIRLLSDIFSLVNSKVLVDILKKSGEI